MGCLRGPSHLQLGGPTLRETSGRRAIERCASDAPDSDSPVRRTSFVMMKSGPLKNHLLCILNKGVCAFVCWARDLRFDICWPLLLSMAGLKSFFSKGADPFARAFWISNLTCFGWSVIFSRMGPKEDDTFTT